MENAEGSGGELVLFQLRDLVLPAIEVGLVFVWRLDAFEGIGVGGRT